MSIIDRVIRVILIYCDEISVFILIKDTEFETCGKYVCESFVNPFLGGIAHTHCLEQILVEVTAVDITAVSHSKTYRLCRCLCDTMTFVDISYSPAVRCNMAFEAPFFS